MSRKRKVYAKLEMANAIVIHKIDILPTRLLI